VGAVRAAPLDRDQDRPRSRLAASGSGLLFGIAGILTGASGIFAGLVRFHRFYGFYRIHRFGGLVAELEYRVNTFASVRRVAITASAPDDIPRDRRWCLAYLDQLRERRW
jgi:hypothetical protein